MFLRELTQKTLYHVGTQPAFEISLSYKSKLSSGTKGRVDVQESHVKGLLGKLYLLCSSFGSWLTSLSEREIHA